MNDDTRGAIVIIGTALFAVASYVGASWIFSRRARDIFRNWATAEGFEITEKRERAFSFPGPFKGSASRPGQVIYSFSVRDRRGHEQSGWALCGSYLGGVFSDKIEIRWDEPPAGLPNKSPDPALASVKSPAEQEPRHR